MNNCQVFQHLVLYTARLHLYHNLVLYNLLVCLHYSTPSTVFRIHCTWVKTFISIHVQMYYLNIDLRPFSSTYNTRAVNYLSEQRGHKEGQ